jgi:hypothetical protein
VSLETRDDIEVWDIIIAALDLCDSVIEKYNIKTMDEWQCPYFRALAKELYWEVEDADG